MVVNLALVSTANWSAITDEVSAVRTAISSDVILKVIIESALWNDEQIAAVCRAAVQGGADFVKTSTGFHKSGGASIAAVQLMRKTVGKTIGVKASGGIRTYADAIAMIDAGANRIGASASRAILAEAQ
jgi:deoxyribose-phosphate aldolase